MRLLIALFLSTIFVLAITHIVATQFYLYWTYLWLDMPMHVLGGIGIAFGISILPFFNVHLPVWFLSIRGYLVLVLMVGVSWEVFEFLNDTSLITNDGFVWDTTTDLILDAIGGTIGYYLITRIKNL